eukprot:scaffold56717_cov33-Tisochrysis_lutea.AAC.2
MAAVAGCASAAAARRAKGVLSVPSAERAMCAAPLATYGAAANARALTITGRQQRRPRDRAREETRRKGERMEAQRA